MRFGFAELNFTVGAFEQNFAKIAAAIARAAAADADLLLFSEMATTGYPPRDLLTACAWGLTSCEDEP
jgi:NAD+ synthase (glutamine-hydrolysing)